MPDRTDDPPDVMRLGKRILLAVILMIAAFVVVVVLT